MGTRGATFQSDLRVGQEHLGHMQIESIYFDHESSFNHRCSLGTGLVEEKKRDKMENLRKMEG